MQISSEALGNDNKDATSPEARKAELEGIMDSMRKGVELTEEQIATYEEASRNGETEAMETYEGKQVVHYGLAADQLKEVYPELVYEDDKGNACINYVEMVPLLVQSINELQARIDEQDKEIAQLKGEDNEGVSAAKARGKVVTGDNTDMGTDVISLSQNKPNPFCERTSIDVNIPETISSAAIFIYDMSGKQIDKITVSDRGASSISVSSTGLGEGMYLYSLIADGKVIATKKMILTR